MQNKSTNQYIYKDVEHNSDNVEVAASLTEIPLQVLF